MLVPLGANPYLCTSTDIEVTPWTEKSNGGIGYLKRKRTQKEPKKVHLAIRLVKHHGEFNI